jgi:hypothetical protein
LWSAAGGGALKLNLREVIMKGVISRLAIGVSVIAAVVAVSVIPASAQPTSQGPVLLVGNPNPGDVLPRGKTYFSGIAYDPSGMPTKLAPAGVDRVQAFAGDRNTGGIWLGTASNLAQTDVPVGPLCQSGNCIGLGGKDQGIGIAGPLGINVGGPAKSGWSLKTRISLKKFMSGTLYFYARSAITGQETVVWVANVKIDPGRNLGQVQP